MMGKLSYFEELSSHCGVNLYRCGLEINDIANRRNSAFSYIKCTEEAMIALDEVMKE